MQQQYGTPTERAAASQQGIQTAEDAQLYKLQPRLPALAAALPGGLIKLPASTAPLEKVLSALYRDGAVILLNAVSEQCVERCKAELEPYLSDQRADLQGRDDTHGGSLTKRALVHFMPMLRACPACIHVCRTDALCVCVDMSPRTSVRRSDASSVAHI